MRSAPTRGRPRGSARVLAVAAGLLLALTAWWTAAFVAPPATPAAHAGTAPRRRAALATAVTAGLLGGGSPIVLPGAPARAEVAWQLKLPRTWQVFSQSDQPPPGDKTPVALVVAGNAELGGEMAVLRVPLDTSDASPDKEGSTAMANYFKSKGASAQQAVEALVKSQKGASGQTKFALVGSPIESTRSGRKYIRYDFESNICQSSIQKGVGNDRCVDLESGTDAPQLEQTHAVTMTVNSDEEGDVLWFVDITVSTAGRDSFKKQIDELSGSFEVGNPDRLEQERTAAIEAQTKLLNDNEQAFKEAKAQVQEAEGGNGLPWPFR